jgi:hypothetical protein
MAVDQEDGRPFTEIVEGERLAHRGGSGIS